MGSQLICLVQKSKIGLYIPCCNRDVRLSFLTCLGFFVLAWPWSTIQPYGAS
jgi:hypothetical protein